MTAPPRAVARLDALVPPAFLSASVLFALAATLRLAGAPGSATREAGNAVRIPAASVILIASCMHLASDWLQTSPPPALDWPASYSNVLAGTAFLAGSIGVATGTTQGVRAGSIAWLAGAVLGALQAGLLLVVSAQRAQRRRRRLRAGTGLGTPRHHNAPRRAGGGWGCSGAEAIAAALLCGSACFVAGSALYLVRPSAPLELEAEICLLVGALIFVGGTAATTGWCGVHAGLVGVVQRHRLGHPSPVPEPAARGGAEGPSEGGAAVAASAPCAAAAAAAVG